MKRRDFSLTCGAMAGAAVLPSVVLAQGKPFQAGDDYLVVKPAAPVEAPAGKIEVVEFFWYNCPHCNSFEPTLEAWVKRLPADVVMRKVPIAFQDSFIPQQRLYYTLEAMGLVEQLQRQGLCCHSR